MFNLYPCADLFLQYSLNMEDKISQLALCVMEGGFVVCVPCFYGNRNTWVLFFHCAKLSSLLQSFVLRGYHLVRRSVVTLLWNVFLFQLLSRLLWIGPLSSMTLSKHRSQTTNSCLIKRTSRLVVIMSLQVCSWDMHGKLSLTAIEWL